MRHCCQAEALGWPLCGRSVDARHGGHWVRVNPEWARTFRRMVLVVVAWTDARLYQPLQSWPWQLSRNTDPELTHVAKRQVAEEFFKTSACCKPPGLARDLQASGVAEDELTSATMIKFFLAIAVSACLSIGIVERQHGTHKQLAHPQMAWRTFSALCTNRAAREQQEASARMPEADQPVPSPAGASPEPP